MVSSIAHNFHSQNLLWQTMTLLHS